MDGHLVNFACILGLVMAVAIVPLQAQDSSSPTNNTTVINETSNASQIMATPDAEAQNVSSSSAFSAATTLGNKAPNLRNLGLEDLNHEALNVSAVNNTTIRVAPISEMAKKAPDVAAAASSVQVAFAPEGALKLGSTEGGWDPFNPKHIEIANITLGLPIKPMRDTEKMVFVCDIV